MSTTPLDDLTVLEWSTSIAGAYAGRLMRDLGAAVVRASSGSLGKSVELDQYLGLGKAERPVASVAELPDLVQELGADIVVLELPDAPTGELADLPHRFADAAVVVITPWGLSGPWAGTGRAWSEFTVGLEAGSGSMRGSMTSYPITTGSSESLWVTGSMAAGAVVTAVQGGSAGRILDLPLLDASVYTTNLFQDLAAAVVGTPEDAMPYRIRMTPSVEPAADGWVGFNLASAANHQDFLVLIDRPEWLADDQMNNFMGRYARYDEWTAAVRDWTRRHTVAEIVERAAAFRIPCAPVHNGQTVLEDPQVVAREFYSPLPEVNDRSALAPNPSMLVDGVRPQRAVEPITSAAGTPRRAGTGQPFEGLRVVDLGTWWVGAYVGSCLGAFGADVVKVESTRRIDGARTLGGVPQSAEAWWEQGNFYLGANFDKRNVTLDITQAAGRDLLVEMIKGADVLIENYAPRVLESVGLDWDAVHAINPRLVMLRMPAFGLTGPRRSMVGYAQTVEQFSGLCWRTGYPGGDPTNPQGPADPMGGANSFFALTAALREARSTGRGLLVEASLAEGALTMSAEQVLRWTARGELLEATGNRTEHTDLQGIFKASGPEQWVGVSVRDDVEFKALGDLIGAPWEADPGLRDRAGRQQNAELLESDVAAWVAQRTADEAVAQLLGVGVPAGQLRDARFVHRHPHLSSNGAYESVQLAHGGTVQVPTLPYRRTDQRAWLTRRPPTLGEHNEEVLVGELGVTHGRMAELAAQQVIGTAPVGS